MDEEDVTGLLVGLLRDRPTRSCWNGSRSAQLRRGEGDGDCGRRKRRRPRKKHREGFGRSFADLSKLL